MLAVYSANAMLDKGFCSYRSHISIGSVGWGQQMLFLSNSAQFQASAVLLEVTVLGQVAIGKG